MNVIPCLCAYSEEINFTLVQKLYILYGYLGILIITLIDEAEDIVLVICVLFCFLNPELL